VFQIASIATTGERHYGVCNANYCAMIERTSQTIAAGLSSVDARKNSIAELTGYFEQLFELLQSLLEGLSNDIRLKHSLFCISCIS